MVILMMEYDLHIALTHGMIAGDRKEGKDFLMYLPHSAILYLEHTKNTPDVENFHIYFQDGGSSIFSVPVMKVQEYSLKMVEEKKLFLLIPFLVIRYKKYVDRNTKHIHNEKVRKSLTGFIKECIMILNRQVVNETMTQSEYRYITELLWKACIHLFKEDKELIGEVQEIMNSIIRLMSDDLEDALRENEELYRKNKEIDRKNKKLVQNLENSIRNIVAQCQNDGKDRDETCVYSKYLYAARSGSRRKSEAVLGRITE